ncbi:MAG: hypothetical protein ABI852_22230, partial [Gemmatimonadaceae bacterium]
MRVLTASSVRVRTTTLLALSLVFAGIGACKKRVTQIVPVPVAGATGRMLDTARGIVRRVGNDPVSVLVLSSGEGAKAKVLALAGAQLAQLNRASGLEVSVAGVLTDERSVAASPRGAFVFQVRHFFVRSADGQPAVDGVLNLQNGIYFLVAANGVRRNVPNLPTALREEVGARIF